MTLQEYVAYLENVCDFYRAFASLSPVDLDTTYFSSVPCDCCGREEGGNRQDMTDAEGNEYAFCLDCVYFAENGRLDDETMGSIEELQP